MTNEDVEALIRAMCESVMLRHTYEHELGPVARRDLRRRFADALAERSTPETLRRLAEGSRLRVLRSASKQIELRTPPSEWLCRPSPRLLGFDTDCWPEVD